MSATGQRYHRAVMNNDRAQIVAWVGSLTSTWRGTAAELIAAVDEFEASRGGHRRFYHRYVARLLEELEPTIHAAGWRVGIRRTKAGQVIEFTRARV